MIASSSREMTFVSDNTASAHELVLAALAEANGRDAAYDADAWTHRLEKGIASLFETEVAVAAVATGTAANALALATLCPPYRGILCHEDAHIQHDEAGAPEFYASGAKLLLVGGEGAKLTPEALESRISEIDPGVHRVHPAVVSITNATEYGLSYTPEEVAAIASITRARGLRLHMDGARLANALVHTRATPAELTWRAGVDALSFGFVKNGGLNAELIVLFDLSLADELRIRRKRAGHLQSKSRFAAAQICAMVESGLWLENARAANAGAMRVGTAAGPRLACPVEANEVFVRLTGAEARSLRQAGFRFHDWGDGLARFVISWDQNLRTISIVW